MPAQFGKSRLVVRTVGSETIVYDPRTHKAHCLGPEAAAVWRECDGHRSASEIAERMRLAGGEPLDETSVTVALRRLERAGLVEAQVSRTAGSLEGNGPGHVAGRRAALRRVAALAGLTVLSLTVPTPEAAAASCTKQVLQTCQRSAECCPTNQGGPACCVNTGFFGNRCLPTGTGTCLP
jgi:DNA-binding transcriptional ArsR family regulator